MDGDGARTGDGTPDRPRWTARGAVRKEDQFTAAPGFIDDHDSRHLPLWGRLEASWHGLSRARRVVLLASVALFATWGGTSAAFALDDLGRSESPSPGSGLSAEDPGAPPLEDAPEALPSGAFNSTSEPPPPLPTLPAP
jgi:hypothetical protein